MNDLINDQIQTSLDSIISEQDLTMLLAIESGSRAWGFASVDSDYDVRFIYSRPLDAYLRVSSLRDVIELPIVDDLDINGWDLQKALGLMIKSNPTIMEWLSSPIIYKQHPVIDKLRAASQTFFDSTHTSHHYLSMAIKNYNYLQAELVLRKKYLYVLRPLFCIEWISVHQTMPPMEFDNLVAFSMDKTPDSQLAGAIKNLLANKKAGKETEKQPRDAVLDAFIQSRLSDYQSANFGKSKPANYELTDTTFRTILQQLAK